MRGSTPHHLSLTANQNPYKMPINFFSEWGKSLGVKIRN